MAYVYRHIRLDKNEPFYIGIAKTDRRLISKQNRNKHWHNIVNKCGYEAEILIDDLTWDEACKKEIEFIALYGRIDMGTGSLVNLTDGGEGATNVKLSDQSRIKMSLGQRGNDKWKKRKYKKLEGVHFNTGRTRTEDYKKMRRELYLFRDHPLKGQKLSQATKDKLRAAKFKKPVLQYTKNGIFVKEYESTKAVTIDGYDQANVWRCCHNKSKSHMGYVWKFKN